MPGPNSAKPSHIGGCSVPTAPGPSHGTRGLGQAQLNIYVRMVGVWGWWWVGGWVEGGGVKTSGLAAKSYRWMANAVAQAHAYIRMCHEKSNQLESFGINCRQARLEEEPNMDDVRPRPTYTCLVFLKNASDYVWPRPSNNATWEWKCLMVVHICHGWGQTVLQPTTYCWQGGRATS